MRGRARLSRYLGAIDPHWRKLVHENVAVDDGRAHVAAAAGVYQGRVRIRAGREMWAVAIDDDQVRALAGFERADLVLEPERARAGARGHPQDVARRQHAGVLAHRLEDRGETHLFEHVEAGGTTAAVP